MVGQKEKITVLIASIKEREKQLRVVLDRIGEQEWKISSPDYRLEVILILNFYDEIPDWLEKY